MVVGAGAGVGVEDERDAHAVDVAAATSAQSSDRSYMYDSQINLGSKRSSF